MSKHLFGNIATARGIYSNNRAENQGNTSTLPKCFWGDRVHVTCSSEAIRWAWRYYWQTQGEVTNRIWDEDLQDIIWQEAASGSGQQFDPTKYIDDDIMGYMSITSGKGKEPAKRRGALEVTRAVSFESSEKIEITFNSRSGSKGKRTVKKKKNSKVEETPEAIENNEDNEEIEAPKSEEEKLADKAKTSIYSAETITSRFQYGFACSPSRLVVPDRITKVLDATTKASNYGGNHARFLFDFSPESAVFRWTDHPVPQFLFSFEKNEDDLSNPRLSQLIECEEIPADEIYILGGYALSKEAQAMAEKGCHVNPSIRKGVAEIKEKIQADLT